MQKFTDLYVSDVTFESKPNGKKGRKASYYRHHRFRAINRKYRIVKETGCWVIRKDARGQEVKGHLHKGKIHCGCGVCVSKTKVWGWKISDQVKLNKMDFDLKENNLV